MKNVIKIFEILLVVLYLTGCTSISSTLRDQGEAIEAPKVNKLDIEGSWKITKYEIMDNTISDKAEADGLLNSSVSFNQELAAVGKNYLANPKYKLKVVNLRYFLINEYNWTNSSDAINKDVDVTSVSDDNNVFSDFIKLDTNNGLLIYRGVLYTLVKLGDTTLHQSEVGVSIKSNDSIASLNEDYNEPVGVLLGIKSSRENLSGGKYGAASYRTIWVSFSNNKLGEIKSISDLLVPRAKGFWTIKLDHLEERGTVNEELEVAQLNETKRQISRKVITKVPSYDLYRDIQFVSNDYIATQYYIGNNFKNSYYADQIMPIDNTRFSKGIDIGTLLGEEAQKAFYTAWDKQVDGLQSADKQKLYISKPDYENYTMARRNGHWILQGKISDKDKNNSDGVSFNINYPPTKKLINHDKLFVPWNSIKEVVPSAFDAYTAYNGRLVFIITKDKLSIYEISKGKIIAQPIGSIDLKADESIVMCEWAVGSQNVERWAKVVNSVAGDYTKKP
jgi:hypothetical protein